MVVMPKIRLEKYKWTSNGIISVVGFAWLNGDYVSEKAFLELLVKHSDSFESIQKLSTQLKGQFSFLVSKQPEVWLACSHTWSYPLFYREVQGSYLISDDPKQLQTSETPFIQDAFSRIYFLNFGVTPLNNTLVREVFQILPGEIICFSENDSQSYFTGSYALQNNNFEQDTSNGEDLHRFLLSTFDKYYNTFKNKQVLVPLTRGYDSRLLACLLKEFGHKNVVCVTWGRDKNSEVETAKKVSNKLGYEHIFVNYSEEIVNNFTSSPEFLAYMDYAGHWSSMPFLYEYFGLKELKRREIIGSDTVVLPGHPGDFLRGEHLAKNMETDSPSYLAAQIFSNFNSSYPVKRKDQKKIIDFIIDRFFSDKGGASWHGYEQWDYQERQCKFIGNSTQVFSHLELDYMMPLFDLDLLLFFKKLPFEQKTGQNLYNNTLEKYFFKKFGIDFDLKAVYKKERRFSVLKRDLLAVAPQFLKSWYYNMNDDIYYREITNELKSQYKAFHYKTPLRPNAYNSFIIQWYLQVINSTFR